MAKCPNCGQNAVRTEDWACQWCGYPLLSDFHKKIPKTFRQLREERQRAQALPVEEEAELPPPPESEAEPAAEVAVEPVTPPEAESAAGLVVGSEEAEAVSGPEIEPEVEVETGLVVGPEGAEAVSEPEVEPEVKVEAEPAPKPKRKPRAKPKKKVSRKKPEPAAEVTAESESDSEPAAEVEVESALEAEIKEESEPGIEPGAGPVAIELTVDQLFFDYESDSAAADRKYTDNALQITGVVDRIEIREQLGIFYITLTAEETRLLEGVRCIFDPVHGSALRQLEVGQKVTVLGKYSGSIIDISLRDCVLV